MKRLLTLLFPVVLATISAAQETVPPMEEISPGVFKIGHMRLDKNAHTLSLPAVLNMDDGYLEYLLVTQSGSTHESLLSTEVQPGDLHFAMLLLGAKGSGIYAPAEKDAPPAQINAEYLKHAPQLKGDSLAITVAWKDGDAQKSLPIEDLVLNTSTKKSAPRGPWIYTGSMFAENKFLAQLEGSFVSLVINPAALINNPRKGNDDDQIWMVNTKLSPPKETPVEVTLKIEAPSTDKK